MYNIKKKWEILRPDKTCVNKICKELKCDPIIASLLVNRNILSPETAKLFFNSSLKQIRSPFSMKDMDVAVERVCLALTNNEKILIFGDYDVDGVTATAILFDFLTYAGANVSYYIPHRIKEGYGLEINHITTYAVPNNINLIITVDCGSASHDAISAGQEAGIDTIVTDHHEISENIPKALAVINPKQSECISGMRNLAGVGVALSFIICLRKYLRDRQFWNIRPEPNLKEYCDLVALGTVADKMPLIDENRIYTQTGIDIIAKGIRPGIKALTDVCGIDINYINAEDIAFKISPRLNAAGRMSHANEAVKLLTTKNYDSAKQIAVSLNLLNEKRRDIETVVLEQIMHHINKSPQLLDQPSIVLSDQSLNHSWHEGVLGIIASRLVNLFFCPVILIAVKNGIGKGSARSIPGFNIYNGLLSCANNLKGFGGHAMAAGISIKTEHIEIFKKQFNDNVKKLTKPDDFMQKVVIDYEIDFSNITPKLIDDLELLAPFGSDNHEPVFMAKNIQILFSKIAGKKHRKMLLQQSSSSSGKSFDAIYFNIDSRAVLKNNFEKIAFKLRWNRWGQKKKVQIVIEEV